MKRIIAAVSFAALVVPTFAFSADSSLPYEKAQFDRILPDVQNPLATDRASIGASSASNGTWASGAWANDHNFISPAE